MEMQNLTRRRVGGVGDNRVVCEDESQSCREIVEKKADHILVRSLRKMRLVGLRQALKPGTSKKECAFWIGVFIVCVSYTAYLTCLSVEEYAKNPTTNTFHDDANINSVPFPAITVTGTMAFKTSGIDNAFKLYNTVLFHDSEDPVTTGSWTFDTVMKLIFAIDHLCEMVSSFASEFSILKMSQTLGLKSFDHWVKDQNVTITDDPNDATMRDLVMPYIRKNILDCQSILVACMWERNPMKCTELFVPVQTDVGVGCSFNRIPEELLKKSQGIMSMLVNRTTSEDDLAAWKSWNIDTELKKSIERLKSSRKFPRSQNAAGNMKGLSFLLLHKNHDDWNCPVMNSKGFLVGVHSQLEEPQMMTSGVAVPPGHEVLVKVRGEVTLADPELRNLAIEKRNCYFQDEYTLKLYTKYTLGNCRKECLANKIAAVCKCHQLSMSSGKNETICGPLQVNCVQNVTRDLDQDGYDVLCGGRKCLAPCTDIKYETNVSYLPYHSNDVFEFSEENKFNLTPLSSSANTSIVHVTFESDRVTTRERKVVLAFAFLVGVIGGIWGMTLEFSVASFFNILAGLGVLIAPVCAIRCLRRCLRSSPVVSNPDDPAAPADEESPSVASESVNEQETDDLGEDESSTSCPTSPKDNTGDNGHEGIAEGREQSPESTEEDIIQNMNGLSTKDIHKMDIKGEADSDELEHSAPATCETALDLDDLDESFEDLLKDLGLSNRNVSDQVELNFGHNTESAEELVPPDPPKDIAQEMDELTEIVIQ